MSDNNKILHIPISIKGGGHSFIEIPITAEILSVEHDGEKSILCVKVPVSGITKQSKVYFYKEGDEATHGLYVKTIRWLIDPDGSFDIIHIFIES